VKRRKGVLAILLVLLVISSRTEAQQVRGEIGVTAERQGVSINIDGHYYNSKLRMFALARLFVNEPDSYRQPSNRAANPPTVEAAVGRFFRKGTFIAGPLAGVDSNKRVIAGGKLVTKLHRHTFEYLGYARIATESNYNNGARHRIMFDVLKDEKLFLRLDWKTEGSRNEHCRVGVEFHRRIDRLNLPVYAEPFWSITSKQFGVRVGTRL
jgi:hypothetical protein